MNIDNMNENINNATIPQEENKVRTDEDRLRDEAIVGDGDIVIEEDFQIDLDVEEISNDSIMIGKPENNTAQNNQTIELGTEQSGNITF